MRQVEGEREWAQMETSEAKIIDSRPRDLELREGRQRAERSPRADKVQEMWRKCGFRGAGKRRGKASEGVKQTSTDRDAPMDETVRGVRSDICMRAWPESRTFCSGFVKPASKEIEMYETGTQMIDC